MANVFVRVNFIYKRYYIWDDLCQSEQEGGYAISKKSGQAKNVIGHSSQHFLNSVNEQFCEYHLLWGNLVVFDHGSAVPNNDYLSPPLISSL